MLLGTFLWIVIGAKLFGFEYQFATNIFSDP